ncbi:hypothetical protein [Methanosarcina barkeri]|uniref:hypothetical protein n=1 Tax=Methanosarcina barkeri TaxID=2208 RepID=UPI0012D3A948|nr:hypothetical protein [Methanosarcina barkeri]
MSEAQRRVEKTTHLVHSSALLSEAKRASCCCDYIATPRKSPFFCDPEAKLGLLNGISLLFSLCLSAF